MKMSCSFLFESRLQLALVLGLSLSTAGPAIAENPFKVLRSKAKQGLSKVTRVVNPKRIGTAIKNVIVDPAPVVPMRRITPPAAYYDATSSPDDTNYVPSSPLHPRWDTTDNPPLNNPAVGPYRYTRPGYQERITEPVTPNGTLLPPPGPAGISRQSRNMTPAPAPALAPLEPHPRLDSSRSPDPEPRAQAAPPKSAKSDATQKAPSTPRQDLPFGELVPGKPGFVYSPYSTKELVDVSGIPTGTKVKCPYSSKTFRVP